MSFEGCLQDAGGMLVREPQSWLLLFFLSFYSLDMKTILIFQILFFKIFPGNDAFYWIQRTRIWLLCH